MKRNLPFLPLLLLFTATLLSVPTDVAAQPGFGFPTPGNSDPAPTASSESYGYQIGLVDTATILMVVGAAGSDSEGLGMMGIGGYVLGGPIVHSAHGNHGRAMGSLALRIGLPILGASLATGFNDCDPEVTDYCGDDDMPLKFMGGLLGVVAASTIDWFLLGRSKTEKKAPGLEVAGVSLQPTLYPTDAGAQLGVLGQF